MAVPTELAEDILVAGRYEGLSVTKETFLQWSPPNDEPFVYEFVNGLIESKPGMQQKEAYIVRNLEDAFYQTEAFHRRSRLLSEIDCWLQPRQMRRPDMALYTADQIGLMAAGINQIPAFVVELTSQHDYFRKGLTKLREYFTAGVEIVWYVFPDEETVYAYTAIKQVTICSDVDLLPIPTALAGLQLTAEGLFTV
jgi:Uma2 family endonuclease